MEKQTKFYLTLPFVAILSLALLTVPFVAMQFTDEVRWSLFDFILMGTIIFGCGSLLVMSIRFFDHIAYRTAMIIAIGTSFVMVWANLAVGLIGSGPNAANLLYIGVFAVLAAGAYLSKLKPEGMVRTMFATACTVMLIGVIALVINLQHSGSSVKEIIAVSLFFTAAYLVAGLLFRFGSSRQAATN